MGLFVINVGGTGLTVNATEISTACSSVFTYDIVATTEDSINISLVGDHLNETYSVNGGAAVSFSNSVTGISYVTSLSVSFSI